VRPSGAYCRLPTAYCLVISVAWCFTQRASAMKIVSSQMLVARSPTRSRFFEIEIYSMQ